MINFVRSQNLAPGVYGFPNFRNCKDPKNAEKMKKAFEEGGPMGLLTVWGKINMGRNMALTFLTFLVVSTLIGYLAHETLPTPANFTRVMQITGTAGILAYCFAFLPNHIWFGWNRVATWMCILDGVIYGLVTGAIFGALWPGK